MNRHSKLISRILLYTSVILIVIGTLLPFLWLGISSISSQEELLDLNKLIPEKPTFERYGALLLGESIRFRGATLDGATEVFRSAFINSIAISITVTLLSLLFGSLAAYAHARLNFRGKNAFLLSAIFIQMLPPIAVIIPLFIIIRNIGLNNSFLILMLIYSSMVLTYVIWIMSGFFKSLPRELEDAARIDGCSRIGTFIKIILPLSLPGLVATGSLGFLTIWNEFFYALVFINEGSAKTLPVAIGEFSTQYSTNYGMMAAGGVITVIPPIILAMFFQKYIVQGLTHGSIKG